MITPSFIASILDHLRRDYPLIDDISIVPMTIPVRVPVKGRQADGWCRSKGVINGKRTFHVGILHTLDTDEAVVVILHEYRHVMQYVYGWLNDVPIYPEGTPRQGWNTTWHGVDYSYLGYWASPWEVDARSFEQHAWEYFV